MKLIIICTLILFAFPSFSGVKADFISAVKKQCGKSDGDAAKLVTPGRTGTVIQFKVCAQKSIKLSADCTISCKKAGATLGQ